MKIFKICTCCKAPWFSRQEFLDDVNIDFVDYQANFGRQELGILLFNHLTCQSTISVPADLFRDFHNGPLFAKCPTASGQNSAYCRHRERPDTFRAECEGAYVGKVMQIVRNWPKEVGFPDRIAAGQC